MSTSCCDHCHETPAKALRDRAYRRMLWAVLAINGAMFVLEVGAGIASGSVSLLADAVDFLGDAGNYAITLFVLGMGLAARARASLVKALTMGAFGLWVIGMAAWNVYTGSTPHAYTMGVVGTAALLANFAAFGLLWRFRDGDSNMRSAWICTRNDVLGNCAVLLAALGVFGTGTAWPDIVVAGVMGGLAVYGALVVARHALGELRPHPTPAAAE
jgi:Co/Zn/Cd efflux system component